MPGTAAGDLAAVASGLAAVGAAAALAAAVGSAGLARVAACENPRR